jgi:hypothetical protein
LVYAGSKGSLSVALGVHDDPFYKPKWRRIALVIFTGCWAGFEVFYARQGLWTVLSLAVFGYCVWTFLLNWKDTPPPDSSVGG